MSLVRNLLTSIEFGRPWLLLLLGLVPLMVWMSWRSLAGLGPFRRWLALGLRCVLVTLLVLALADLRLKHAHDSVTVLFLVDRSLSVPEEYGGSGSDARLDRRWERIKRFMNDAVQTRGLAGSRDLAGVIVFGKEPRLELPPSDAVRLNLNKIESVIDSGATDIAAAIKLALASFPEGTGKRIILLSDGNENLGNAEEQARLAAVNGVQIDVVPLGAGERRENEVLVQSVEAQPQTEEESQLLIRVLIRSLNPKPVVGTLSLVQVSEGKSTPVVDPPPLIKLEPGLNSIPFKHRLDKQRQSYTYQAVFEPKGVEVAPGRIEPGLPGDRWQNNRASTHVVAVGQRRVLFLEEPPGAGKPPRHDLLLRRLRLTASSKFRLDYLGVDRLPQERAELGIFLSNYDCVVLADIAAEWLSKDQQEMLRSNTHDQGCGLVVIGGRQSYGAGGWQDTPLEKALPVDADIKSLEVEGQGGLALIMHASEMADGNRWQKEIAKLAVKKLSSNDQVGVLYFDWGATKWHIDLTRVGDSGSRQKLLSQIDTMSPGDMPEFDTALSMAHKALTNPAKSLAVKHVIIISDGDPVTQNLAQLATMKTDHVTVTTVGVATHGPAQDQALKAIADATGGRYHHVKDPAQLPAVYIKEVRTVSRSFIVEKQVRPSLRPTQGGPVANLSNPLPPLHGYVRTTPKPSLLVDVPIEAAGEQRFPILAYWQYGLGRAVAFTSDARSSPDDKTRWWDHDWAESEMYSKFWEQLIDWALRPKESGRILMRTQLRDGFVRVSVDTRESGLSPDEVGLELEGNVTTPGQRTDEGRRIKFQRKGGDLYEAEFKADEAGSYFLNAHLARRVKSIKNGQEVWTKEILDSTRGGVTLPYSPEFAELETNTQLLGRIRDLTGGKTFADDDATLAEIVQRGEVFRRDVLQPPAVQPVWPWLALCAAVCLFFDVAVRRIAIEPAAVMAVLHRSWERFRGRAVPVETPAYFDRLRSRKEAIGDALDKTRAAQRFEPTTAVPPAPTAEAPPQPAQAPPKPAIQPSIAPNTEQAAEDYASRLLKAKKRVWEGRDKEPPQ